MVLLDFNTFLSLRLAKPLPGAATFGWIAEEPYGLVDFTMPELGFFCWGRWHAAANTLAFDQELGLGFTTVADGPQLPVINMNPAMRGVWVSGDDDAIVLPIIAVAQTNPDSGLPGWYTSFGSFNQDRDGLIYAPQSTTEVVGLGTWIHRY